MELLFERTFLKDVERLTDRRIKERVAVLLGQMAGFGGPDDVLAQVPDVKKMQGFSGYYRIRLGDFRLGFAVENSVAGPATLRLIRFLHRREMYRYFP